MPVTDLANTQNTIHIPDADLSALTQESLENPRGIERLERAAVSLYKALLSTRDTRKGIWSVLLVDSLLIKKLFVSGRRNGSC